MIAAAAVLLRNIEAAQRLQNLADDGDRVEGTVIGLGGAYRGKTPTLVSLKVEWRVDRETYTGWVRTTSHADEGIGSPLMLFYDPDDPGVARPVAGFNRRREERLVQPSLLFALGATCLARAVTRTRHPRRGR